MRLLPPLAAGLAFALAALSADAQTQTVVRITGSTAYRGATHTAITRILQPGYTFAYTGSSLSGAAQAIFSGSVGSTPVIIKTAWSGSLGGVQTVSQGLSVPFLPDGTAQTTGGTGSTPAGTSAEAPEIAMSDSFQNSTPFTTPVLNDQKVGVVPFKWVASNGAPAALNNFTPQLAQQLFSNGSMALSLATGATADRGVKLFALGRDPDSGTRLTAFAESGVGVDSAVVQYQPTVSGTAVTGQTPWPVSTINGITYPEGQGGYASGSALAAVMTRTTAALNGYYVTYLSVGDAGTALAGGARELPYNGVPYSLTALQEGLYTFWGYEHLMYKTTLDATRKSVAEALAAQITSTDATVLLSTMKVERLSDGGLVRQNF